MIADTMDETMLIEPGAALGDGRGQDRARFVRSLIAKTRDPDRRELLDAHTAHMPPRYWARVDGSALRWHLNVLRAFFLRLNADGPNVTVPVVRWRHVPERGYTEVAVCTWDRIGLMARVAGAFAEVGINILRADVYTRADNVVLDFFHVSDGDTGGVCAEKRLLRMRRLLATLFHPERELAVLGRIPTLPAGIAPKGTGTSAVVRWDLEMSAEYAALEIEAADRVGLLYMIFRVLAGCGLSVAQAVITTENNRAGDVFFVTDQDGRKVSDPVLLETVEAKLLASLS